MMFYDSARDIFDMFRAQVPVFHGPNLENVPLLAMIFHNDCMYIAHSLLTLAHSYKHRYAVV